MKYKLRSFFISFIVGFILLTISDSKPNMYSLEIHTYDHLHSIPLGNLYANIVFAIFAGIIINFAHNFWRVFSEIYYTQIYIIRRMKK